MYWPLQVISSRPQLPRRIASSRRAVLNRCSFHTSPHSQQTRLPAMRRYFSPVDCSSGTLKEEDEKQRSAALRINGHFAANSPIPQNYSPERSTRTDGRGSTLLVLMTNLAGVSSGPSQPSFTASMRISPGSLVDCTMTCASPLNSDRLGSLSLSWQLGSPLPTPRKVPSPVILNDSR